MDIVTADSFVEIFATVSEFVIWRVEGERGFPKADPRKIRRYNYILNLTQMDAYKPVDIS